MLGVVSVGQHLSCLFSTGANMQQAQGQPSSLASNSAVKVQHVLEVLKDLIIPTAQACQAQAKTGAMLRHLQGSMLTWMGTGTVKNRKEKEKTTPFGINLMRSAVSILGCPGQVGLHCT